MPQPDEALRLRGVGKSFGDAQVLDNVDFDLRWGEVHALLGENGAGKSTLMNVLTGHYVADSGAIDVDERPAAIHSPAAATALGISMVHQHFRLVRPFTGRENLRLAAPHLSWAEVDRSAATLMDEVGLDAPLDLPVADLAIAEQQRIEILKALTLGARILVLDEPTAVLTDAEATRLLRLVRDLAMGGHAIVFITHKLRELEGTADRVSVLRRGKMVLSGQPVGAAGPEALSAAMIGEALVPAAPRTDRPGETLLDLQGLSVAQDGAIRLHPADLKIRAGEIVGLAGVGGNGQRELAEAILGLTPSDGRVWLDNADLSQLGTARRRAQGLRYIPADRRREALALNMSIADNLAATAVRTGGLGRYMIAPGAIRAHADRMIDAFAIAGAPRGGRRPVRLLSGGNAQKVVLARELDDAARLIVAHSPTQGLDVSAQAYVHTRLVEATRRGAGVLLISEDLEEVLQLSDTIHVISRGKIASTPGARPSRAEIGTLMLGHA